MKTLINKFSIAVFSGLVVFTSCSKSFTEKTPQDAVPIEQALGTEAGLGNALNGAYSNLRSVFLFGRDLPIIGDLMADNTFIEVRNSGRYLTQYNYTFTSTDAVWSEIWSTAYTGILRANQIIDATPTGGSVPQIKAQAHAIRALLYFRLVTLYAKPYTDDPSALGVPLILNYDPYKLPNRNKVSEVYAQIVSDLQAAFKDAPAYSSSVSLSKYAVEALLSKVYLYMGDKANARTAALDVINNSGFTLVSPAGYKAFWANSAIQSNKEETLFEVDADVINNNGFDDIGGIYINGYQDIYVSNELYKLYSTTDIRKSVLISGATKSGASAVLVNKYPNAQSADRDNLKVMRLSEVYLIAAEASLATSETEAKKYLNALMAKRDASFAGYTSSGATLVNNIIEERRKELAFEGDRFFDLNRLKLPINRAQNSGAIPATGFYSIPYPDNKRVAPIPQSELQTNANIAKEQNPGY